MLTDLEHANNFKPGKSLPTDRQMSTSFEITGDDIAQLNDADLRELIGLLCEADYRFEELSTKGITWGGHQDSPDGGLDVEVKSDHAPPINCSIPRAHTGIQVKRASMGPAKIDTEMRPKGVLRTAIRELIENRGAYIIVSSRDSTSNTTLRNRIKAMRKAVANEPDHEELYLDFLDRGRVATWVRNHRSLILWVCKKIGKSLKGWHPYENWAHAPGGLEERYLLDDRLRLHDSASVKHEGVSVEDGILRLRSVMSSLGTSTRLVGLSGVGKTRLVQALFDSRIGEKALNKHQAFYTDTAYQPDPDPCTLATNLISEKTRALLIVDNCSQDLHRRLSQICSESQTTVSLLTVEYDIRDDLPENTNVFRLEPASKNLIADLIKTRFQHLSYADSSSIAEFSGGNARVAIALAGTVNQGETLSSFRDETLFKRLFWLGDAPNENLLISAEACSLVYSFNGEDVTSSESELCFLASIIQKSSADLFRDVADLAKRGLVQSRGIWRAVLPHAIANRLARRAMETTPNDYLVKALLERAPERLIKSFTRRLSYLHDCEAAVAIATDWLQDDGWIGKSIDSLNGLGIAILNNLAPAAPTATIDALERAANGPNADEFLSTTNGHHDDLVQLLRHLAYDANLFDRSVSLLIRFALSTASDDRESSARNVCKSLFYILYSGTHASLDAKANVIEELVDSAEPAKQELGLHLLDAALDTRHPGWIHDVDFGARPRGDFGYHPESKEAVNAWFQRFIRICTRLAVFPGSFGQRARLLLADKFEGLWNEAEMWEELEASAATIIERHPWNDGWIMVRTVVRYSKDLDDESRARLQSLDGFLKPKNLLEQARTFALSEHREICDLDDTWDEEENEWQKVDLTTYELGAKVAQSEDDLEAMLPKLVSTARHRVFTFGRGLAVGSDDRHALWNRMRMELETTPPENREIAVFLGFLDECWRNDKSYYNKAIDDLVHDELLGEWFPTFQSMAPIDTQAVNRLHEALDGGKANIETFRQLAWGRKLDAVSDDDVAELLNKMLGRSGGRNIVFDILGMRCHNGDEDSPKWSDNLIALAKRLLSSYSFDGLSGRRSEHDYELAQMVAMCFSESDAYFEPELFTR